MRTIGHWCADHRATVAYCSLWIAMAVVSILLWYSTTAIENERSVRCERVNTALGAVRGVVVDSYADAIRHGRVPAGQLEQTIRRERATLHKLRNLPC